MDDDHNQLELRRTVLEISGYEVVTADNAHRGMQLFASHSPDAVILDYEMPVVNGEQLAGRMRHADRGVPIVMLSGCVAPPTSVFQAVDRFIAKDHGLSCLLATLNSLTQPHGHEARV